MENNINSLKEWHKLLEDGIISEHEYEAKKREVLGLPADVSKVELQESTSENPPSSNSEFFQEKKIESRVSSSSSQKIIQHQSSGLNANQIFLLVVGALLLVGGVFWFWKNQKNHSSNSKLNASQIVSDSAAAIADPTEAVGLNHEESDTSKQTLINSDSTAIIYDSENLQPISKESGEKSTFAINTKINEITESCYRDPCSVGKTISVDILKEDSYETVLKVKLLGGEKTWDSEEIVWNSSPHNIFVKCSKTNPTITIGNQSTIIPLNKNMGIPGVLVSDAETYLNYCHSSTLPIDQAVVKFNYNVRE